MHALKYGSDVKSISVTRDMFYEIDGPCHMLAYSLKYQAFYLYVLLLSTLSYLTCNAPLCNANVYEEWQRC